MCVFDFADCASPPPSSSVGNYTFYQGSDVGGGIISCIPIGAICDTSWLSMVSLCQSTDGCIAVNMFYSNSSYHSCLKSASEGGLAASSLSPSLLTSTGVGTMNKPGLGSFALPGYVPLPAPISGTPFPIPMYSSSHPIYLGCYKMPITETRDRLSSSMPFLIIPGTGQCNVSAMSVSACASLATRSGLTFFGVQVGAPCLGSHFHVYPSPLLSGSRPTISASGVWTWTAPQRMGV